jgi:N utilization substance protein A
MGAGASPFLLLLLKNMDIKKLPKTEFAAAVAQIAGERNIDVQLILDSIELGLISAYKRDQKERGMAVTEDSKFEAELSPETGSFKIIQLDGDQRKDVTPPGFGRIAAQTAKQVIDQSIHEAEKETILAEYRKKIGTLILGSILKVDSFKYTVGVGRIEAICPREELVKSENINPGDKKLFLIKDIVKDDQGRSDIVLSRRDPEFIRQLFVREVPEVANRSVSVDQIARNAGVRTKVAVSSKEAGIDPIGSCIGQKGSRVQSILNELSPEEKVDVIQYSKNLPQFIIQALSPANGVKVVSVEKGVAYVTVPENQLALAIGSGGDNVHLAGILTGVEIKVQAEKT